MDCTCLRTFLLTVFYLGLLNINKALGNNDCRPICYNSPCQCPGDLFLLESNEYFNITACVYSTTTVSINATTVSTTLSTDDNVTNKNICVSKCPTGYYGESQKCFSCNALCSNCTGSGNSTDVCTCKYGNDTNGICLKETKKDKLNVNDTEIIIGAAVGGGALLIIIVIVAVICCCRRKREVTRQTRMSVLINERDNTVDNTTHIIETESAPRKLTTLQRQNYVNTETIDDAKVAKQAQLNQDKIFRYVKDPATGAKKKVEVSRESEIYTNSTAIKLNKHMHGENEAKELSLLPPAPNPPGKKKTSFFKKSRRGTENKSKQEAGVSNRAFGVKDEQEDYEDMSGKQPNYTPFNPEEDGPKEDYENFQKKAGEDMPLEDYENFGKTSANRLIDDEQEDYENLSKPLAKPTKYEGNDDEEEQEDYENVTARPNVPHRTLNVFDGDGPLDDYENFQKENPYMNVGDVQV